MNKDITTNEDHEYKYSTNDFKIDQIYYEYLYNINKLFTKNNYISKISSKYDTESISQILIYYKKENITNKYILIINNKYDIEVTIPLKNCNYTYRTNLYSIEDCYEYIKLHLK